MIRVLIVEDEGGFADRSPPCCTGRVPFRTHGKRRTKIHPVEGGSGTYGSMRLRIAPAQVPTIAG
jgi:hypothetical protein